MSEIKQCIAERRFADAVSEIGKRFHSNPDTNELLSLAKHLKSIPRAFFEDGNFLCKKIAFLNGYSTQFISDLSRLYLLQRNIFVEVYESDYGLFEQAIFSKDARLLGFKPDIVYFCVGSDHLSDSENSVDRWVSLWENTHRLLHCDIIQNTFEEPTHRPLGNFGFKSQTTATQTVKEINDLLAKSAPDYVHFNDVNELAGFHGRKNWRDEKLYHLSKIPVSYDYLTHYAENLAGVIAAIFGRAKKCLVLDLDNTLWGGVIGDDGLGGIEIGEGSGVGEAYKHFQTYIKGLKDRGVILAVCSKNDEITAQEPFLKRKEMILKLDDISCFVANWEPKSENIARIAKTLNIGLDSMVFFDDNPAEREIVRENIPAVTVIDVPEDPSQYTVALSSQHLFEIVSLTKEDLARTDHYRANIAREKTQENIENYSDYLTGLKMEAVVAPFDEINLARITQLINKTNQFNVTTRRYTNSDVTEYSKAPGTLTRYLTLKDKFGDNGLVSVFIGNFDQLGGVEPRELTIDTWLMSCRVLKRGVEDYLFKQIVQDLIQRRVKKIIGIYIPTEKNGIVQNLFQGLGFSLAEKTSTQHTWHYDLNDAKQVQATLARPIFIEPINRKKTYESY